MKKLNPNLQAMLKVQGEALNKIKLNDNAPASGKAAVDYIDAVIKRRHPKVKATPGENPQAMVDAAVKAATHPELRAFLAEVFAETDVLQVVTQRQKSRNHAPRYPIESLSRAAQAASYWHAYELREREVLYVAIVIQGVKQLLEPCIVGNSSPDDVMATIARSALHRLEEAAPYQAWLLRMTLGWGNADEVDAYYVPRLQQAVALGLEMFRPR